LHSRLDRSLCGAAPGKVLLLTCDCDTVNRRAANGTPSARLGESDDGPINRGDHMIERKRGRALMALRERHFRAHPLCVGCLELGRLAEAVELDHIRALVNGGSDTPENLQGLCAACHKAKTARDMGHRLRPVIGLDGYPVA